MNTNWFPFHSSSERYQNNLSYLSKLDHELYTKLMQPEDEILVIQSSQGFLRCKSQSDSQSWIFGHHSPQDDMNLLRHSIHQIPDQSKLLIFLGLYGGYVFPAILPWIQKLSTSYFLFLETSNSRLKLALHAADIRAPLTSGRIHFSIINPAIESIFSVIDQYNLWNLSPLFFLQSPYIVNHLDPDEFLHEYNLRSSQVQQRHEALLNSLYSNIPSSPNSKVHNVLLVNFWPNAPQSLHIESVRKSLEKKNIHTEIFDVDGYRFDLHASAYRRMIERPFFDLAARINPDLIISYAYHAPHLLDAATFESLQRPWLQVVSNLVFYDRCYYSNEYTAVAEERLVPIYQQRGSKNVFFLPLMANYVSDHPVHTTRQYPIVFIGNSLELSPRDVHDFHQTIENRPRLRTYIHESLGLLSNFDRGLTIFDYLNQNPIPDSHTNEEQFSIYRYLLCQSSAARRKCILESIADDRLYVFGNWPYLSSRSRLYHRVQGPISQHEEIELFPLGHLFINIHSTGCVTGPTMRFFNVPGMGGLLLSDGQFSQYLQPGSEYLRFTTLKEFQELISFYLAHPESGDEIRQKSHARIQRDWTYDHWLECVFSALQLSFP